LAVNFDILDNAIKKMGGELTNHPIDQIRSQDDIIVTLKTKGVEIDSAALDKMLPVAGLLHLENNHAFLYIKEPFATLDVLQEPLHKSGPRFHVVKECKHIQQMLKNGRKDRYVLIQNKDGTFPCHPRDYETRRIDYDTIISAKLRVCQGCLERLNYQGFLLKDTNSRTRFVMNFNLNEFLNHYEPFFIDQKYYKANNLKQNGNYTIDHAKIRENLLLLTNYTCQGSELKSGKCDVQLKDHPEWLHMHHINGQSGDNNNQNIKILCISCHQRQPLHGKLKVSLTAINEINRRRKKMEKDQ